MNDGENIEPAARSSDALQHSNREETRSGAPLLTNSPKEPGGDETATELSHAQTPELADSSQE
jgi:hypothetical protein